MPYCLSDTIGNPTPQEAPLLGIVGRYVMILDLFECITRLPLLARGELQFTDAIRLHLNERQVYAWSTD
jgi:UTP-glucose-1-phosphate uridylyltransferase